MLMLLTHLTVKAPKTQGNSLPKLYTWFMVELGFEIRQQSKECLTQSLTL